jgi:4-hydroxy-3-polyprenylbenzoate decarboxylase
MGQMMFTKGTLSWTTTWTCTTPAKSSSASAPTPTAARRIFTKGPSDVFDHATSEIASGSKLGIDATKKLLGEASNVPGHR